MSNAYINHHLPPTCFGVCYTNFRETTALLAQKLQGDSLTRGPKLMSIKNYVIQIMT